MTEKDTYKVDCYCTNCGSVYSSLSSGGSLVLAKGVRVTEAMCPYCECSGCLKARL
jgi:hypothetical protein